MAKKDFLKNLGTNKSKIENFENSKKNKKKSILTLYLDRSVVDQFKEDSFLFFKDNQRLDKYSYSNYLKILLENAKMILEDKYGEISTPDSNYMQFYSRKGNVNRLDSSEYPRLNVETMTFSIGDHQNLYYNLMHTYYINEKSNLPNYSTSFFFYDLIRIVKSLDQLIMFSIDD